MRKFITTVIIFCVSSALSAAQVQVQRVQADGALTLSDGRSARLAGLYFPPLEGMQPRLAEALEGHQLRALTTPDRYGHVRVQGAGEEALLRQGLAVIYSDQAVPPRWRLAEAEARKAGQGIWGQDGWRLRPEQTHDHLQQFHVVEGTITRMYVARDATYLNFGEDWQTDFSVVIRGRERRAFTAVLAQLAPGARVAVRGVLYSENGPMLRLTRPEQLTLLD